MNVSRMRSMSYNVGLRGAGPGLLAASPLSKGTNDVRYRSEVCALPATFFSYVALLWTTQLAFARRIVSAISRSLQVTRSRFR